VAVPGNMIRAMFGAFLRGYACALPHGFFMSITLVMLGSTAEAQPPIHTLAAENMQVVPFVISSDPKRLEFFLESWELAWPELDFNVIHGNVSSIRGVGLTQAYVKLLEMCIPRCGDILLVLEDDAIPFADDVKAGLWPSLFLRAWAEAPGGTDFLLLGAHHIKAAGGQKQCTTVGTASINRSTGATEGSLGFAKVTKSFGTYAWSMRANMMESLHALWKQDLQRIGQRKALSPDVVWYGVLRRHGASIPCPLLSITSQDFH